MTLKLTSTAFPHQEEIPSLYTCDGRDISPPLSWSGVPPKTKSLALIAYDPDAPDPAAPKMTWVHWVLYNLPRDGNELRQEVDPRELPAGTREGQNSWRRTGYGGPCPPIGRHRYFFKLFALETVLPDLGSPSMTELEAAIRDHILEETELMGTYQR
jgi:Raf kinase inhibitor-like YbhB/YbcL family protein